MTTKAQTQKRALGSFIDCAKDLQDDFEVWAVRGHLPPEWDDMDMTAPVAPKKEKVSLRLDADALRYFRSLGPGYTTQINRVLRTFVMGRISNAIYARDQGLTVSDIAMGYRQKSIEELEMEDEVQDKIKKFRARQSAFRERNAP